MQSCWELRDFFQNHLKILPAQNVWTVEYFAELFELFFFMKWKSLGSSVVLILLTCMQCSFLFFQKKESHCFYLTTTLSLNKTYISHISIYSSHLLRHIKISWLIKLQQQRRIPRALLKVIKLHRVIRNWRHFEVMLEWTGQIRHPLILLSLQLIFLTS